MTTQTTFIAFASPKGGSGKSTSCLSIAGALASKGYTVKIVDFDQTQTLYRWYTTTEAQRISNINVVLGPHEENVGPFLGELIHSTEDFVLLDLAGMYCNNMLQIAGFSNLTITPAKLSEPDILEATKLSADLQGISKRIGKPVTHRILINERPNFLAAYQAYLLQSLNDGQMRVFNTMIYNRGPYGEAMMTGIPAHYADKSRAAVSKAVDEIDTLMSEIYQLSNVHLESIAA